MFTYESILSPVKGKRKEAEPGALIYGIADWILLGPEPWGVQEVCEEGLISHLSIFRVIAPRFW